VETPTREQQLRWVEQYKAAARELEAQRRRELRALTEDEALRQSEILLSIPASWRARPDWSGLVEQQALFRRMRP